MVMKNIQKLGKECVGCTTCQQVCPQNCISFLPDREGFFILVSMKSFVSNAEGASRIAQY